MTLHNLIDFVLHLDRHLGAMVHNYGPWAYGILFLIIFCETGLVVTPFLPGDSLLFAAGSLAAIGSLSLPVLVAVLFAAAVIGDNTNYFIGRQIGSRAFTHDYRWLSRRHLERTHQFFERYGPRAVILARFVPIVRTFTPFVAGVGEMKYSRFLGYDLAGGMAWVGLFSCAGYWFGNLPKVRENFSVVILGIIVISTLPIAVELARSYWSARSASKSEETG
jgi:membrane-associated protein